MTSLGAPFKIYSRLPTEKAPSYSNLDKLKPLDIARLMNKEDAKVVSAVKKQLRPISKGAEMIRECLAKDGRVFLFGAGTSGRLGVLEAAECPPTFGTHPHLIQAVVAGGKNSVFASREGAEDIPISPSIQKILTPQDAVIGIAASGLTPFTRSALKFAKKRGCPTIFLTCNSQEAHKPSADIVIALDVGPEIIAGSTRLKAGTATKLALNMLTTISMIGLGKTYGSWMVDLKPNSRKLKLRAVRIVSEITQTPPDVSEEFLNKARGNAKLAILMIQKNLSLAQARQKLAEADGFLRRALV